MMTGLAGLPALPHRLVLSLPAKGHAVRTARETTEQILVQWGIGLRHPHIGPALLVLAELVTNSVRHAAELSPTITVLLAAGPETLAFAVHDKHPYRPELYGPGASAAGGGLATVTELITGLGGTAAVHGDAKGPGKSVWITVPL
ncbi:ATP-binding protein [Streptomyces sp. NPDC056500]|uniref:ATP-binding protein n=1 Tax=Streptomyces sp. NPDC056500 TaxID=3345840 RepID=UPI00367AE069